MADTFEKITENFGNQTQEIQPRAYLDNDTLLVMVASAAISAAVVTVSAAIARRMINHD